MSFISIEFLILLVVVLSLLITIKSQFCRKLIVLSASCVFYAYWDWRFLGLLVAVTVLDYFISKWLFNHNSPRIRKGLLTLSIVVNLSFLGVFKYFNFFIDSLNFVVSPLNLHFNNLSILLPIGISFYTFETISYVADVYRHDAKPANSLMDYAIFISFFPRLVAGPIMRASQFLPQLERGIFLSWNNLFTGSQIFLRGMIKKMVIADSMAIMVDQIYSSPSVFSSSTIWLGVFAYSIQILFDFSGYTDMALGIGRILGFQLPENFDNPYSSTSITEFWKRWHKSLSTWLRDYLYISLGGNRKGNGRTYLNLFLTMVLGGLWHGASWNFVFWGGLQGLYLVIERMFNIDKIKDKRQIALSWLSSFGVFTIISVTWVFFRSPSLEHTIEILSKLLFMSPFGIDWLFLPALIGVPCIFFWCLLTRYSKLEFPILSKEKSYTLAVMISEILLVYFFSPLNTSPFIYFQF